VLTDAASERLLNCAPHNSYVLLSRSAPVRDLLLCAKHLFFAAKAAIVLAEAQGDEQ